MKLNDKINSYSNYTLFNILSAGVILLIPIYFGIFSVNSEFPLNCIYYTKLGITCPSCGISRSLSSLMHLNFMRSMHYNSNGVFIFTFFCIQFLMRIILIIINTKLFNRKIIRIDFIFSIVLFFIGFGPLIIDWVQFWFELF